MMWYKIEFIDKGYLTYTRQGNDRSVVTGGFRMTHFIKYLKKLVDMLTVILINLTKSNDRSNYMTILINELHNCWD